MQKCEITGLFVEKQRIATEVTEDTESTERSGELLIADS